MFIGYSVPSLSCVALNFFFFFGVTRNAYGQLPLSLSPQDEMPKELVEMLYSFETVSLLDLL